MNKPLTTTKQTNMKNLASTVSNKSEKSHQDNGWHLHGDGTKSRDLFGAIVFARPAPLAVGHSFTRNDGGRVAFLIKDDGEVYTDTLLLVLSEEERLDKKRAWDEIKRNVGTNRAAVQRELQAATNESSSIHSATNERSSIRCLTKESSSNYAATNESSSSSIRGATKDSSSNHAEPSRRSNGTGSAEPSAVGAETSGIGADGKGNAEPSRRSNGNGSAETSGIGADGKGNAEPSRKNNGTGSAEPSAVGAETSGIGADGKGNAEPSRKNNGTGSAEPSGVVAHDPLTFSFTGGGVNRILQKPTLQEQGLRNRRKTSQNMRANKHKEKISARRSGPMGTFSRDAAEETPVAAAPTAVPFSFTGGGVNRLLQKPTLPEQSLQARRETAEMKRANKHKEKISARRSGPMGTFSRDAAEETPVAAAPVAAAPTAVPFSFTGGGVNRLLQKPTLPEQSLQARRETAEMKRANKYKQKISARRSGPMGSFSRAAAPQIVPTVVPATAPAPLIVPTAAAPQPRPAVRRVRFAAMKETRTYQYYPGEVEDKQRVMHFLMGYRKVLVQLKDRVHTLMMAHAVHRLEQRRLEKRTVPAQLKAITPTVATAAPSAPPIPPPIAAMATTEEVPVDAGALDDKARSNNQEADALVEDAAAAPPTIRRDSFASSDDNALVEDAAAAPPTIRRDSFASSDDNAGSNNQAEDSEQEWLDGEATDDDDPFPSADESVASPPRLADDNAVGLLLDRSTDDEDMSAHDERLAVPVADQPPTEEPPVLRRSARIAQLVAVQTTFQPRRSARIAARPPVSYVGMA